MFHLSLKTSHEGEFFIHGLFVLFILLYVLNIYAKYKKTKNVMSNISFLIVSILFLVSLFGIYGVKIHKNPPFMFISLFYILVTNIVMIVSNTIRYDIL